MAIGAAVLTPILSAPVSAVSTAFGGPYGPEKTGKDLDNMLKIININSYLIYCQFLILDYPHPIKESLVI